MNVPHGTVVHAGAAPSSPKVSVLVPLHNDAAFLDRTFEHLTRQTYRDAEIIVRDDASTDDTLERVLAWARRDPRIRVIRNAKNLGRVGQYEVLLYDDARGMYVLPHDGNDYVRDDDFIERCVAALDSDPRAVVAVGEEIATFPGDAILHLNRLALDRLGVDRHRILSRDELLDLLPRTPIWVGHASVARRDFLLDTGVYRSAVFAELAVLPFLRPGDRLALVRTRGRVWTYRPGVGETDLLGGRCGGSLATMLEYVERVRARRPEVSPREIALLGCHAWSCLYWSEILSFPFCEIGRGMTWRDIWDIVRIRALCTWARTKARLGLAGAL